MAFLVFSMFVETMDIDVWILHFLKYRMFKTDQGARCAEDRAFNIYNWAFYAYDYSPASLVFSIFVEAMNNDCAIY